MAWLTDEFVEEKCLYEDEELVSTIIPEAHKPDLQEKKEKEKLQLQKRRLWNLDSNAGQVSSMLQDLCQGFND